MTIEDSNNDQFNLDSINTLSGFDSVLQNFKPIIGNHGGRRFVYEGKSKSYCLNDFYKKLDTLVRETLSNNQGYLSRVDDRKANKLINDLNNLDDSGYTILKDKNQTTNYQRFTTFFRQIFGNLFYKRARVAQGVKESVLYALRKKVKDISEKTKEFDRNFPSRYMHMSTKEELAECLFQDLKIERHTIVGHDCLWQLALNMIYNKKKSSIVLKNLDLFQIDPTTPEGQEILTILVQITFDKYKDLAKNDYLKSLFSQLDRYGLTNSMPEIKEILLEFVKIHGSQMGALELRSLGLNPSSDQELLLKYFKESIQQSTNPPHLTFLYWKDLGISPHQNRDVFNFWKNELTINPDFVSEIKNAGFDLFNSEELLTCIELIKLAYFKDPLSFDLKNLKFITGLTGNSLEEWKALTTILRAISKETEVDKNIWEFIKDKKISGLSPKEKEYLRWLTGKELVSFNIPFRNHDSFTMLPPEQLRDLFRTFDSESLVNVLLAYPKKITANTAWISLLERYRSYLKHDNLMDLIGILSPSSIVQQIQTYGSNINIKLRILDLTGVIYTSDGEQQQNEQKEILIKILQSCPYLEDFKLPAKILIDEDIVVAIPHTLRKLTLKDCTISSLCLRKLPHATKTLVLNDVVFSTYPVEVSSNLCVLQCDNVDFSKDKMISLPDTIEEFSFRKWESEFKELQSLLPPNLKKLGCGLTEHDFTQEIIGAIPNNLEVFNPFSINLKKATAGKIPSCIKKVRIINNAYCWDGTFNELLSYLPSELETLSYDFFHEENNIDLGKLPKNLNNLSLINSPGLNKQMFENKQTPENIETLLINWNDSFSNLIPLLPQNIKHLDIHIPTYTPFIFSDVDIQYLPLSLKSLSIPQQACSELTEEGKKKIETRGIKLIIS